MGQAAAWKKQACGDINHIKLGEIIYYDKIYLDSKRIIDKSKHQA